MRVADAPLVLVQDGERFLEFGRPGTVLAARDASDVAPVLEKADAALQQGRWIVGYLAYEAAAAFGFDTHPSPPDGPPLAWFAVCDAPRSSRLPLPQLGPPPAARWQAALTAASYETIVARLQERIAAGDCYQANLTFPLSTTLAEEPFDLFVRLVAVQRPRHAAYLDLGRFVVLCASPELFFRREGGTLTARPMKGTAARGGSLEDDERQVAGLRASEKDRAENLMIVDMLRNDLGRVAEIGSVAAGPLFEVERYPTLLQMTSSVRARSRAPLAQLMAALFPCASVTGAPKQRTMRILSENEVGPRGVYTGAIGWAAPGGDACFAVAIRTAVADRARGTLVFGVGSGIVADSNAQGEYAECLLKARVLEEPAFALVETIACFPEDGFRQLAGHLVRLRSSARHFAFHFDGRALERALREVAIVLQGPRRVRLLLFPDGRVTTQTSALPLPPERPLRVGLALRSVDATSCWLQHKTTRRELYQQAQASRPDCDEVLLWNHDGEITESPIANVVVEQAGERVTPPLASGLLAGVARAQLLAEGRTEERVVRVSDLSPGSRVWLVSALRGVREGVFVA
jgi:para-aminobenzoate synthetase/4-amino-4-deoxychorismate lyase